MKTGKIDQSYSSGNAIIEKLHQRWLDIDSMAGVGIDPNPALIPQEIWDEVGGKQQIADGFTLFGQRIIDATADHAVDFKINSNYFMGDSGQRALLNIFQYLKDTQPNVLRICDGKFGEVGHTAERIADFVFGELDADAVLLNPYLGLDAIAPFAKWKDKLIMVCVNTSNSSADTIQNAEMKGGVPLWRFILEKSLNEWNENQNIIPVLSATHQENLKGIRNTIGDTPIVLAGIGTQGGDINSSIPMCLDSQGYGLMVSASRSIIYPERHEGETLEAAMRKHIKILKDSINKAKLYSRD